MYDSPWNVQVLQPWLAGLAWCCTSHITSPWSKNDASWFLMYFSFSPGSIPTLSSSPSARLGLKYALGSTLGLVQGLQKLANKSSLLYARRILLTETVWLHEADEQCVSAPYQGWLSPGFWRTRQKAVSRRPVKSLPQQLFQLTLQPLPSHSAASMSVLKVRSGRYLIGQIGRATITTPPHVPRPDCDSLRASPIF